MFDEKEFIERIPKFLETYPALREMPKEKKERIIEKAKQCAIMINDLEGKQMVKEITKEEADIIQQEILQVFENIKQIGTLATDFSYNLIKNNLDLNSGNTIYLLKDQNGQQYKITVTQAIMLFGLAYASACEVIKHILVKIIKFKKPPSGIGSTLKELEKSKVDVSLFSDVDDKLRNSFSHLDFKIKPSDEAGVEISYYDTNRIEYKIKFHELLQKLNKVDNIINALILIEVLIVHKSSAKII